MENFDEMLSLWKKLPSQEETRIGLAGCEFFINATEKIMSVVLARMNLVPDLKETNKFWGNWLTMNGEVVEEGYAFTAHDPFCSGDYDNELFLKAIVDAMSPLFSFQFFSTRFEDLEDLPELLEYEAEDWSEAELREEISERIMGDNMGEDELSELLGLDSFFDKDTLAIVSAIQWNTSYDIGNVDGSGRYALIFKSQKILADFMTYANKMMGPFTNEVYQKTHTYIELTFEILRELDWGFVYGETYYINGKDSVVYCYFSPDEELSSYNGECVSHIMSIVPRLFVAAPLLKACLEKINESLNFTRR